MNVKNLFKKRKKEQEPWAQQEYDAEKELKYSSIDIADQHGYGFHTQDGFDKGLVLQPANTNFRNDAVMAYCIAVNTMRQFGLPDKFGISTEEAASALEKGGYVLYADNKPYLAWTPSDKPELEVKGENSND